MPNTLVINDLDTLNVFAVYAWNACSVKSVTWINKRKNTHVHITREDEDCRDDRDFKYKPKPATKDDLFIFDIALNTFDDWWKKWEDVMKMDPDDEDFDDVYEPIISTIENLLDENPLTRITHVEFISPLSCQPMYWRSGEEEYTTLKKGELGEGKFAEGPVNSDVRGMKKKELDLPYSPTFTFPTHRVTLEQAVAVFWQVKSHKFENWYEMCNGIDLEGDGIIKVDYDHGS